MFCVMDTDETDNKAFNTDVNKCMQIFNYLRNTVRETTEITFLHNIHACITENSLEEKTSLSTACKCKEFIDIKFALNSRTRRFLY